MVEDGDAPLSSEETLRAAYDDTPSDSAPEVDPEVGDADDVDGTEGRWLTRSGLTLKSGNWYQRLKRLNLGLNGESTLTVDDEEAGLITTSWGGNTLGLAKVHELRLTKVSFSDGSTWKISTEEPGPRATRQTRRGRIEEMPHSRESRVIVVQDGQRRLAETRGELIGLLGPSGSPGEVVANGISYNIYPTWKSRSGKCGTSGVIRRRDGFGSSNWSITTTEPLPLSVVLLHWHILIGDWRSGGSNAS